MSLLNQIHLCTGKYSFSLKKLKQPQLLYNCNYTNVCCKLKVSFAQGNMGLVKNKSKETLEETLASYIIIQIYIVNSISPLHKEMQV